MIKALKSRLDILLLLAGLVASSGLSFIFKSAGPGPLILLAFFSVAALSVSRRRTKISLTVAENNAVDQSRDFEILKKELAGWKEKCREYLKLLDAQAYFVSALTSRPYDGAETEPSTLEAAKLSFEAIYPVLSRAQAVGDEMVEMGRLFLEIYHEIPYLNQLLKNITEKTESAAFTLIEKFGTVSSANARANRDAEKNLKEIRNTEEGHTIEDIISESRAAITRNSEFGKKLGVFNQDTAAKLKKIGQWLEQIENLMNSIEAISQQNKVISLNSFIESAKLGEQGKGLKVLAKEIEKLSRMTTDFTKQISGIMRSFRNYNESMLKDLDKNSNDFARSIDESVEASDRVLSLLMNSYQLSTSSFLSLKQGAAEVSESLKAVTHSLQFQDITRQQIEHISEFLVEIQNKIEDRKVFLKELGVDVDRHEAQVQEMVKTTMKKKATVDDERIILN